ncbi:hypothetical protein [Pseudobacteriovorax antillogorgiicola]|uniref:Uncharacterized protein n=1 Tax=Pseudobacteriovorax antillogorgiicola TaxID=1513793 RepID=A0A1Y6CH94_9BACT|nr:hypothetical protein [Pseudobacteriovorax antillogorgiicola]TCS47261.1 hypothetical protein EDD56_12136 [Pseudobacteriovorax antillogorgiicola]SMF62110.1 hypothetical protein SAMN06296036_12136 [Pseudobacteriovorax antillogorgiicola]
MKPVTAISWIACLCIAAMSCESQNAENPTAPNDEILVNGGDAVGVQPENPGENPDAQDPSPPEMPDIPVASEDEEGVITLNVVPGEQLPDRLKTCLDQGVAGEVTNGSFACNQQALVVCNDLSEGQKLAAKTYSEENIPDYALWGCSVTADETPMLHFYMTDGVSLKIFNLAVQKAAPAQ